MTENQKKILELTDEDFYSIHTSTIRLVNEVAKELGLEPTKRCLDCVRKKWFEIRELLDIERG